MRVSGTHFGGNVLAGKLSPLGWLIVLNVAVFILQSVVAVWFKKPGLLEYWAGLSGMALVQGWVWTPITYAFLHEGFLHILLNMMVLVFSWRPVSAQIGERRSLWLYFACVLGGAFLWMLAYGSAFPQREMVGASAGAFGLFAMFCLLYWERPLTFLLFFLIPITVKPKWVLLFFGGMEVFSLLFRELPERFGWVGGNAGIAFSAHVGGLLVACAYYWVFHKKGWAMRKPSVELPAWMHRASIYEKKPPAYRVNFDPTEVSQGELNRILDKIASHGFSSLTPTERAQLDRAHDALRGKRFKR